MFGEYSLSVYVWVDVTRCDMTVVDDIDGSMRRTTGSRAKRSRPMSTLNGGLPLLLTYRTTIQANSYCSVNFSQSALNSFRDPSN